MKELEIVCGQAFEIGKIVSVFLNKELATVRIIENTSTSSFGHFYKVEILEYPAKKVVV